MPSVEDLIKNLTPGERTVLDLSGDQANRKLEFTLKRDLPPEPR